MSYGLLGLALPGAFRRASPCSASRSNSEINLEYASCGRGDGRGAVVIIVSLVIMVACKKPCDHEDNAEKDDAVRMKMFLRLFPPLLTWLGATRPA